MIVDASKFSIASPGSLVDSLDALGNRGRAFVPSLLPTGGPDLSSTGLRVLLSEADRELARLDGVAEQLERPKDLFRNYLRREAVLSSAIEGTHTTVADLALYEATRAKRTHDEPQVENYVKALDYGWTRVGEIGVGRQLFLELHDMLMDGADQRATPGRLRDCQVFIGPPTFAASRFVPPPDIFVAELLHNLETYLATEVEVPLLKLAIAHYQFEAIHPFRDGNGRLGRLMIVLWLRRERLLNAPMLYLSAFFERHRDEYYDRLLAVSVEGAWNAWAEFFLRGIVEQARDARIRTQQLSALRADYRARLSGPRMTEGVLRLVDALFASPVLSVPMAARLLGVTYPAAKNSVDKLIKAEILAPDATFVSGTSYYVARDLIRRLEAPAHLLPAAEVP